LQEKAADTAAIGFSSLIHYCSIKQQLLLFAAAEHPRSNFKGALLSY